MLHFIWWQVFWLKWRTAIDLNIQYNVPNVRYVPHVPTHPLLLFVLWPLSPGWPQPNGQRFSNTPSTPKSRQPTTLFPWQLKPHSSYQRGEHVFRMRNRRTSENCSWYPTRNRFFAKSVCDCTESKRNCFTSHFSFWVMRSLEANSTYCLRDCYISWLMLILWWRSLGTRTTLKAIDEWRHRALLV